MAIAFKAVCALNAFALQYVNSQCQHDSLPLKLAAKLHLFTEPTKSPTDYFPIQFSICGLCILDFVSSMRLHSIIPLPSSRGPCINLVQGESRYPNSFGLYVEPPSKFGESKHDKGGIATPGRFPPLPINKPRNACVSEAMTSSINGLGLNQ